MANSQSGMAELNDLWTKFHDAAGCLNQPDLDVDNLWLTFEKLAAYPPAKKLPQLLKAAKDAFAKFSEHAIIHGSDGPAVYHLIKNIRLFFLDYLGENDPAAQKISILFDDLEYALLNNCIKLSTRPYRKKLREANRYILHEKRRYYTIFNRMLEPACIIDHELRLVETNRAFSQFFKLSGKDHIGKNCSEIIGRDILDTRISLPVIEATLEIDNIEKNVIISRTFLGDINNEFSGGIIIIQDVTHQKEYEKALQKSEEKYRTLIENVPDVTWRAGEAGNLYFISQNIENICGYKPEDMLGAWPKGCFANIHPDDLDYVRDEFSLFFASHLAAKNHRRGQPPHQSSEASDHDEREPDTRHYDVRYRFRHKDGRLIWLHSRASNIYRQNGTWFADGVFSDITALKKAEEELEQHQFRLSELVDERTAELRQANAHLEREIDIRIQAEQGLMGLASKLKQSNEELEQFAHVASHDLKEPLMLITAFSERLVNRYSGVLDDRGREYLMRIVASTRQMQQLIDGLLELSRVTSHKKPFELLDLNEVVNEVSQNLEEHLKQSRGRIQFENLGKLIGDKTQIRQLFQNIIANAIKYKDADKEPLVTIKSSIVSDNFCQITIQDNGIGFDPIYAQKIFLPLTRLHGHKKYEGTGIGLATCQKIVVHHGGEIEAKSTPGQGTTIIVRLPLAPDN
ncbi:MAG: PAS domain S-box protein [Deltaproteobacteria bacterium]|nr:PAS domain S-box protein [Deltaproteobacteria bacterium]